MDERLGIVGSGAIAGGLAATAATAGEVILIARSERSAERARGGLEKLCGRLEGARADRVTVATELDALGDATFVVEAVVEDMEVKRELLGRLGALVGEDAVLATTTSSLSVSELARASGREDRFAGLHVFNPVPRMELIELVFPEEASERTRARTRSLTEALGKHGVEVPDLPGFVVNRLLFPYLFAAVDLLEETGLEPEALDACMVKGAGHPLGPLALLDLVGLDVAQAIGETIGVRVPPGIRDRVIRGQTGRKSGGGFYGVA